MCVGTAAGGDASEAEPEQPHPSAGGGQERPAGAAGGGGGGAQELGETAGNPTGPGQQNTHTLFHTQPCFKC